MGPGCSRSGPSPASGVPHLLYHSLNTDPYGVGDLVASLGGLALGVVLPVAVLWLTWPRAADRSPEAVGARR